MDDASLIILMQRVPITLTRSLSDNIEPKVDWLQKRVGLIDAQMGKLITGARSILAFSISDILEPKLDWLQKRLPLNDAQVSKIVHYQPTSFYLVHPK